ncbi:alpha/beta fold hydrolase [Acidisarcina polymorpha]|nr:alpha/beta hydrolase [Acidisarcina polymorpha]
MHLNCSGTGRPTIVAEAGSGEDSLTWTLLQNSLSSSYRFCSYDRAGTGWSEPRPGPRDSEAIASQLHELLKTAHEKGPVVLLAHSLGGLYIKEYAQLYPDQVAALIFLDATTPATYQGRAADALGLGQATISQLTEFPLIGWAAEVSGYDRLMHQCSGFPSSLSSISALYQADQCIASQDREQREEAAALPADEREVTDAPVKVPVLVLSEDKSPILQTADAISTWDMLQNNLLKLSAESYRIKAVNSDHFLQLSCPNFTSDQIRVALTAYEKKSSLHGTTTSAPCR